MLQPFLKRQKRLVKARSYVEAERYLLKHFEPFHGLPYRLPSTVARWPPGWSGLWKRAALSAAMGQGLAIGVLWLGDA